MVRIRLSRGGRKNLPVYRIVIADSHTKRDGRFIEIIGEYRPIEPILFNIDLDRYNYWVSNGAQPSERIQKLVEKNQSAKK